MRARQLGLAPGLMLADARALVPDLAAVDIDREADRTWLTRIADFCDRYTPLVSLDEEGGVTLDITGCAHLFGGEEGLRADLTRRLSRITSLVRSAIAGTPHAARALARYGESTIVEPGMERDAVRALPVAALDIDAATIAALEQVGLRSIGALVERPRIPLAERFGRDFPRRLARLLGEEDIGITPRRPLPLCSAERQFAEPIARIEDILDVLASLFKQNARTLEERGEGGRRFEAGFFRADGGVTHLIIETGRPTRDPDILIRLFRERLDALNDPLDPGFGYDLVRLSVLLTQPLVAVQNSLDGHTMEDGEVAALVDRLTTRLGADAVLRFLPQETYIPERAMRLVTAAAAEAVLADGATDLWPERAMNDAPLRPLYLFAHPELIETLAEVPDGPPLKFRWRRVLHDITRAEGPERIAPEWWRDGAGAATRDYFRVEDADGHRFWLYREGLYESETGTPRWFMHGLFA